MENQNQDPKPQKMLGQETPEQKTLEEIKREIHNYFAVCAMFNAVPNKPAGDTAK